MKRSIVNTEGMTLIEVIVALVICVIFLGIAFSIFVSISNNYERIGENTDVQQVSKNLIETIRGKCNYSNEIDVVDNKLIYINDGQEKAIYLSNEGYLMIDAKIDDQGNIIDEGQMAYPVEYYGNRKISSLLFTKVSSNKVKIEMELMRLSDQKIYSKEAIISPFVSAYMVTDSKNIVEYERISNELAAQMAEKYNVWDKKDSLFRTSKTLKAYYDEFEGEYPKLSDREKQFCIEHQMSVSEAEALRWRPYVIYERNRDLQTVVMVSSPDTSLKTNVLTGYIYWQGSYYYHTHGYNGYTGRLSIVYYNDRQDDLDYLRNAPIVPESGIWVKVE